MVTKSTIKKSTAVKKAATTKEPTAKNKAAATTNKAIAETTDAVSAAGPPPMSSAHKQALAAGREQGRIVRRYLEALEAHRPKRGRKRTTDSVRTRLDSVESTIPVSDPLTRLHLIQERIDLEAELESINNRFDIQELEDAFVKSASVYGQRKGITYTAWREAGVEATVLRRAAIPRTRS